MAVPPDIDPQIRLQNALADQRRHEELATAHETARLALPGGAIGFVRGVYHEAAASYHTIIAGLADGEAVELAARTEEV